MTAPSQVWKWEEVDPNTTGASGDLSKIFRNEAVKTPGVLGVSPPAPEAALLVREVIQNAWDAALAQREDNGGGGGQEHFEVTFEFKRLQGDKRDEFVRSLGLRDLSRRVEAVGDRQMLGLSEDDCLKRLDGDGNGELSLLVISEKAGGGMHGPWKGDQSKLWMALCSIGITSERQGRGGSYGYGKAGLIRGSKIRSVIAYTCFAERSSDPGVTRRLLAMTYWDRHRLDGTSYTGSARLGSSAPNGDTVPFENEQADQLARELGIAARNPAKPKDLGTTLLLVEPTVKGHDLVAATARYWWPALCEPRMQFEVRIVDEERRIHRPRPKSDPHLRPFIDSYEIATTPQDNKRADARRHELHGIGRWARPGVLGMKAEIPGWSYPESSDSDTEVDHRSLIALVRKPRMVVEYHDVGRLPPYVRGTFVADDSVNEALRRTEPKAHDAWQTTSASGDIGEEHVALSQQLLKRIKQHVLKFRGDLKPPPKPSERMRLPEFDRIMRIFLSGGGTGRRPPRSDKRLLSIRPGGELERLDNGRLRLTGVATVGLSEHGASSERVHDEVEVSLQYRFIEDDRLGDRVELDVQPPVGFESVEGRKDAFRGRIPENSTAQFHYLSEEYSGDWTAKLIVDADFVGFRQIAIQDSDGEAEGVS